MVTHTHAIWMFIPQIIATVFGTLIAISDGMVYGWTSPYIPYFLSEESHIIMTASQADWLETIVLIGEICGLPFTIYFVDKIGRKKSMLLSAAVGLTCWVTILFANRIEYLYVARFFAGMAGDMCFVAAPMYIAEIADPKIRGFLSATIYVMMVLGILIVYIVGAYTPFYISSVIGILLTGTQLIVFPFLPESPYYFVFIGQLEKARTSLLQLRGDANIEDELNEITFAVERQKAERGRPQDLILIPSNRQALLIMIFLNSAQHLVGISVMLMNLHTILTEAGSIYIAGSAAAVTFASLMLASVLIGAALIDRFGRKVLLMSSGILTGVCLLILSVYFHLKNLGMDVKGVSWIPSVCVMVYGVTFKFGLGLVPIVVTAEIFPTTIKAIGMTIAEVTYVVAALVSVVTYQALCDNYGIHVPFYLFTLCSVCITLFTKFCVPETKGKTLDEIQLMLKGGTNNKVL